MHSFLNPAESNPASALTNKPSTAIVALIADRGYNGHKKINYILT
ncbi:hypothetical protein [Dysgonomonas sp. Marseille-P4677]|nr:hypothetical protein [Dysgonomonas sp. Marseille-P4677]